MNLQEFIAVYNGHRIWFDDESYQGQCTQIVKFWAQANGWPIPNSGGTDKAGDYKNFTNGYNFIKNTPAGVPNPGDIMVWNLTISGGYGHVSIFVSGDTSRFTSFDQNWPKGSVCHIQTHNYGSVAGWLRPTGAAQNAPQAPPALPPSQSDPKYPFMRNLYPGLYHDGDVLQLQRYLENIGFFSGIAPTGNYLSLTKAAVANFQVAHGIVPSLGSYGAGYCGPKTRAFINSH